MSDLQNSEERNTVPHNVVNPSTMALLGRLEDDIDAPSISDFDQSHSIASEERPNVDTKTQETSCLQSSTNVDDDSEFFGITPLLSGFEAMVDELGMGQNHHLPDDSSLSHDQQDDIMDQIIEPNVSQNLDDLLEQISKPNGFVRKNPLASESSIPIRNRSKKEQMMDGESMKIPFLKNEFPTKTMSQPSSAYLLFVGLISKIDAAIKWMTSFSKILKWVFYIIVGLTFLWLITGILSWLGLWTYWFASASSSQPNIIIGLESKPSWKESFGNVIYGGNHQRVQVSPMMYQYMKALIDDFTSGRIGRASITQGPQDSCYKMLESGRFSVLPQIHQQLTILDICSFNSKQDFLAKAQQYYGAIYPHEYQKFVQLVESHWDATE